MEKTIKPSCLACHFLCKTDTDPGIETLRYEVTRDQRNKLVKKDLSWRRSYAALNCFKGIWAEGCKRNNEETIDKILQVRKPKECFFFEYSPGMGIQTATELWRESVTGAHPHLAAVAVQQSGSEKEAREARKVSLKGKVIKFDPITVSILVGKIQVPIPRNKNEHWLCKVMLNKSLGKWVSYDEIREKIFGEDEVKKPSEKKWRPIYDAMTATNKRVKKAVGTADALFSWADLGVIRNY